MVKFFEGEKTQPRLMPVHQIEVEEESHIQFLSEIRDISQSLRERKFNMALPLVCLTEEEDHYQLLTGRPILEAAKLAGLTRIWVFLIAEVRSNALILARDFPLQAKMNQPLANQQIVEEFICFLNQATEADLVCRISGVGSQYAKLIQSKRPFKSQDDLKKLGPKRSLQWLQAYSR